MYIAELVSKKVILLYHLSRFPRKLRQSLNANTLLEMEVLSQERKREKTKWERDNSK